ncbi:MAG: hypothetical protein RR248_05875 [Clostridia bacterium]
MKEIFEQILDKDEEIIEIFKPNKRKLYTSTLLLSIIAILVPVLACLLPTLILRLNLLLLLIPIGVFIVGLTLTLVFLNIYYNNLYYAYTDKRLITRTGVFGIDYRFLVIDSIGATNVYVSLIDKLVARNTGSLMFGSMSSPLINSGDGANSGYRFNHIVAPYEMYKKIKAVIDQSKNAKL